MKQGTTHLILANLRPTGDALEGGEAEMRGSGLWQWVCGVGEGKGSARASYSPMARVP